MCTDAHNPNPLRLLQPHEMNRTWLLKNKEFMFWCFCQDALHFRLILKSLQWRNWIEAIHLKMNPLQFLIFNAMVEDGMTNIIAQGPKTIKWGSA